MSIPYLPEFLGNYNVKLNYKLQTTPSKDFVSIEYIHERLIIILY